MYRTHLLVATLVLCAAGVFAQDQQATNYSAQAVPSASDSAVPANTEPWRIIPKQAQESNLPSLSTNLLNTPTQSVDDDGRAPMILPGPDSKLRIHIPSNGYPITLPSDSVCYYIRSYLVARDSKDSDSTHLVGTSTCQPAARYRVKTTDPMPYVIQP